jgi:tryptophan-rich sensory protein
VVIALACVAVDVVSGLVSAGAIEGWYRSLAKPAWTPTDWVFGPVWTALYASLAVAAGIVWFARDRVDVCGPLGYFGILLAATIGWSIFFFGFRSPLLGLLGVTVLWTATVLTAVEFFRVNKAAGVLLVPYGLWISYAAVLNADILLMNR